VFLSVLSHSLPLVVNQPHFVRLGLDRCIWMNSLDPLESLVISEIYEFLRGTPSPLGNPSGFRGVSEKLE